MGYNRCSAVALGIGWRDLDAWVHLNAWQACCQLVGTCSCRAGAHVTNSPTCIGLLWMEHDSDCARAGTADLIGHDDTEHR